MFLQGDHWSTIGTIDAVLAALQSVRDSRDGNFHDVFLKAETLCDMGKVSSSRKTVQSTDAEAMLRVTVFIIFR